MVFSYFKTARRRKLLAQPFPRQWLGVLEENVGHYRLLPAALQSQLRDKTRLLFAELRWEGAKGFTVTEEMKITVAAQASLLLLGNDDYYFDRVTSVLLHGGTIVKRPQLTALSSPFEAPKLQEEETELLGEAWHAGSILFSWPAVLHGGRNPRDGENLVLHELAHHLDGLDGDMGGSPPMSPEQRKTWDEVSRQAMGRLGDEYESGQRTLLDPYGLTNPAEFFAVTTECFFERPSELQQWSDPLYAAYRTFYGVDPAAWFGGSRATESRPDMEYTLFPATTRIHDDSHHEAHFTLPPLETADRYFTRGIDLFQDAHFAQAELDFDQAVRFRPDDQEALLYRARCRLFLGHDQAALADADRACRLDPGDSEALSVRGMCHVSLADFDRGIRDITAAERIEDLNADAHFYRGVAYAELQQWRRAIEDFTRVLKLDASDSEAYRERSRCYEMLGDHLAAERDRERSESLEQRRLQRP